MGSKSSEEVGENIRLWFAPWRKIFTQEEMLTSPKKPSRFPLLQSMEFVVAISNTDWCIQIMKDTDDFVDIMKMLLLLKKVRCLWY